MQRDPVPAAMTMNSNVFLDSNYYSKCIIAGILFVLTSAQLLS